MYTASPAGNWNVKNANMIGIIQSSIWFVWACFGSGDGIVVIFCWTHIEMPTSTGNRKLYGIGCPETRPTRSIPRNSLPSGTLD